MATYDIEKITLPNGDICELSENRNLIINGGPEWCGSIGSSSSLPPYTYRTWGMYNNSQDIAYNFTAKSDGNSYVDFNNIQIKIKKASDTTSPYVQLQHHGFSSGRCLGNIITGVLNDGDTFTVSFDYKITATANYFIRYDIKVTSSSEYIRCADNPDSSSQRTMSATNSWTRVSHTFTVPAGYSAIENKIPNINALIFLIQIYPTAASTLNIRHIQVNKGTNSTYRVATDNENYIGSVGSWIQSGLGAPYANIANLNYKNASNFFPIHNIKSVDGMWTAGTYNNNYVFSYVTDTNLQNVSNYAENYYLPPPDNSPSSIVSYDILTTKGGATPIDVTSSLSPSTGVTLNTSYTKVVKLGNIATVSLNFTTSSQISVYGIIIQGLPAPLTEISAPINLPSAGVSTSNRFYINANTTMLRTVTALAAGSYEWCFTYVCV